MVRYRLRVTMNILEELKIYLLQELGEIWEMVGKLEGVEEKILIG